LRVAIDTGGTFTDCVYFAGGRLRVLKVFSTPGDPSLSVLTALGQIGAGREIDVRHGTTVGTNTMLERKGARVALVSTEGFEDTIAIGRQTRSRLYDWFAPAPVCLVPRELRFGVPDRVSAEGEILRSPAEDELETLVERVRESGAEAVAISLLFSFLRPETELRVEEAMGRLGVPVSTSHRILPEFREYERASTTVVNAYLAPRMQGYLNHLEEGVAANHSGGRVDVMQSSGGIIPARLAAREPVRTLLSGPAGGVIGASRVARWAGCERIIGLDVGGTSTDVFLADLTDRGARLSRESIVAGAPIGVPMLEIHTAGAGGGSIARFDAGGMLRVGPESAGAEPGPICFGHGERPTVTDANMVLGRMDPLTFLDGGVQLDMERTELIMREHMGPIKSVEEFAAGILRVIESHMERAIRVVSVERGHDPRDFTLVAFGGGGPLHACSLAWALRIATVLVPPMPGALSALGILLADTVRDYSQTVMLAGHAIEDLPGAFLELEARATADFDEQGLHGTAQHSLDIRYCGQGHELSVPFRREAPAASVEAFHQLHRQRYGICHLTSAVEIVNLRLRMTAAAEQWTPRPSECKAGDGRAARYAVREIFFGGGFVAAAVYRRNALEPGDRIEGPAMITEYTSATVVPPDCVATVDALSNLVISIGGERRR